MAIGRFEFLLLDRLLGCKTFQSNSDRKAAGFGSPPSCAVLTAAGLRRFRPRMEMDPAIGLGSTKRFGSPG
jgi:hypothetical protein